MKTYGIREVCELLGVKVHVLRYWEQEIPLLSPEKTLSGRRVYHDRDIQILYRMKHLVYDRKYTIEGARRQIIDELGTERADSKSVIHQIRSELVTILSHLRNESDGKKDSTD
jgi:DNA-binding transcriptional MerR regulator